jgi:hypothetical protein
MTAVADPLTATPPPVSRPVEGWFERPGPARLILLAFPFLCLPVAAATLTEPSGLLLLTYIWLFGMTHFVITFAVYASAGNLKHFASSWRNRTVFFVLPALIFIGFDLLHALRFGAAFPVASLWLWAAIRVLDFNHFNRQSFGVLQLFKARAKGSFTPGLKRLEDLYFFALSAILWTTFLAGGASPLLPVKAPLTALVPVEYLAPVQAVLLLAAAGLLIAVWCGHRRAAIRHPDKAQSALCYLAFQSAAALAAASYFPLYAAALAVHYVEYHALMVPRVFHTPLDPASRVERNFGRLRARPIALYLAVLGVALLATAAGVVGMGMMGAAPATLDTPAGVLLLLAAFDGLFVFHYVVEMVLWKFSDPHFRRTLAPLYFAPKPA